MRRHKSPAKPTAPPVAIPTLTEDQVRLANTISYYEDVLGQALDPVALLDPEQIFAVGAMFLSLMKYKSVTPQWWSAHCDLPMDLMKLASQVRSEAKVANLDGLTEAQSKTVTDAIKLSVQEIKVIRGKLLTELKALVEIPLPWATRH